MGEPIQSSYSESERERLYKRTLTVVSISQLFGGAGLAAGITVGALLAEDILGTASYAGLPTALFTIGSAVTAFIVGKTSQHYGRRIGLTIGFIVGGLGALGVVLAAILQNIFLLFFFYSFTAQVRQPIYKRDMPAVIWLMRIKGEKQ